MIVSRLVLVIVAPTKQKNVKKQTEYDEITMHRELALRFEIKHWF